MENLYEKLMHYSLGLLSKRAYTVQGIEDKLIIKARKFRDSSEEDAGEIIAKVIVRLKELSYLDDLNYAKRFV